MNQSEIFKAAHKMAKDFVGHYVARFALALKSVYQSLKGANTMRTSTEIKAEIDAIKKRDAYYNELNNEGSDGYYNDSVPAALWNELTAALDAEWNEKWTADYAATARAKWNAAAKIVIDSKKYQYQQKAIEAIEKATGFAFADIKKAKEIYG